MTFIVDMNIINFVGSLKVTGAQMFGFPNVWLVGAFIPIKVRLLLFGKNTYNFGFSFREFAM